MNDHLPHAQGLRHDLERLALLQDPARRRALRLLGGLVAVLFHYGQFEPQDVVQTTRALTLEDIVRSDIRSSFGTMSGTADGVPLTVTLKLVSVSAACANLEGYAVYLWHCTREGGYSLYSSGVTAQNYLRGVQVSNASGELSFTTVFPGCYSGRWPHIHFEVFSSLSTTTSGNSDVRTSQLALPESVCRSVYGSASGYTSSLTNLNAITLASDNIFSDGYSTQMATVTGDLTNGFAATLTVGV